LPPHAGCQRRPRAPYAADRTVLAAERTCAVWVRTGVVSLAAGVGAKTSLGSTLPEWAILFFASLLVLFSAFCFAVAVWHDLRPGHDTHLIKS
jgi:putative membrane protein